MKTSTSSPSVQKHGSVIFKSFLYSGMQGIKFKSFVTCFSGYTPFFNSAVPTVDVM